MNLQKKMILKIKFSILVIYIDVNIPKHKNTPRKRLLFLFLKKFVSGESHSSNKTVMIIQIIFHKY